MHIRKSTWTILSSVTLLVAIVLLVSAGWARSSEAPDWKLQDHWDSWKGHLPFVGGSKHSNGTGLMSGGTPIADEPGITPDVPAKEAITPNYTDISIKDEGLRNKLSELLARPIRTHKEALAFNVQGCPIEVADKQVNQDQLKGNSAFWERITTDEISQRRKAIVGYLETAEKDGAELVASGQIPKGRGIVMTGGNKDTVQRILVSLRILRHEYKCKLGVEVFSFPGEITNQNDVRSLGDLGATVRELSEFAKVDGAWKNFQIKAAAIAKSSFGEVLYIDSDNIPLSDPSILFNEPLYRNGPRAVFWPDFNKDHPQNAIWRVLGVGCNYGRWELESGQILIDKRGNGGLNLAALYVAVHMAHEQSFYYMLSGGDKDTFRYAFWALGLDYTPAPRWLSSLGSANRGQFCGVGMLQYGLSDPPKPQFAHLNLLKHTFRTKPVFTTIQRAAIDAADSRLLDRTTVNVYKPATGGMCAEIKVDGPAPEQKLVQESWADGEFSGFEDMYFKHGGTVGGW
ncbi:mannosyltransferase putative-domain-containing protein [Rhizoctonia solani]|nr:mannosyltransferase putative-domain-containing protein [Rhizoctonia solani]